MQSLKPDFERERSSPMILATDSGGLPNIFYGCAPSILLPVFWKRRFRIACRFSISLNCAGFHKLPSTFLYICLSTERLGHWMHILPLILLHRRKSQGVFTFSQSCSVWLVTLNLPFLFSRPVYWNLKCWEQYPLLSLLPEDYSARCVFSPSWRIVLNAKSPSPWSSILLFQKLHFLPSLGSTWIVILHSVPLGYAATESFHLLPLFLAAPRHSMLVALVLWVKTEVGLLGLTERLSKETECSHSLFPPRKKLQAKWISLHLELCHLWRETDIGNIKLRFLIISECFFSVLCSSAVLEFS